MLRNLSISLIIGCCFLNVNGYALADVVEKNNEEKNIIVENSALDSEMFYNILTGSILANSNNKQQLESAFKLIFNVAKKVNDVKLFEIASYISMQSKNDKNTLLALNTWQKQYPNSPIASVLQIKFYLNSHQLDKTIVPIRKLIENQSEKIKKIQIINDLPKLFNDIGDRQQVINTIKIILKDYFTGNDDLAIAAWSCLAYVQFQAEQQPELIFSLNKAFNIENNDHSAAFFVAVQSLEKQSNPQLWQLLQQYFTKKNIEPLSRLNYAEILLANKNWRRAQTQLEIIQHSDFPSQKFPRNDNSMRIVSQTNFLLANLYAEQGNYSLAKSAAINAYSMINSIEIKQPEDITRRLHSILLMANVEQLQGDFEMAYTWMNKIEPSQRKTSAEIINNTFKKLVKIAYGYSIQAYQQSPDTDIAKPILLLPAVTDEEKLIKNQVLANFYEGIKQPQKAYQTVNNLLKIYPLNTDLLLYKLTLAEQLGYSKQIEPITKQILAINPHDSIALNNFGYLLLNNPKRLDEAINYIKQALELKPDEPMYLDSLGYAYVKKKKYNDAIELLRKANKAKSNPEIAAHLIEALWLNQQKDQAQQVWKQSYKLFPNAAELKSLAPKIFNRTTP